MAETDILAYKVVVFLCFSHVPILFLRFFLRLIEMEVRVGGRGEIRNYLKSPVYASDHCIQIIERLKTRTEPLSIKSPLPPTK